MTGSERPSRLDRYMAASAWATSASAWIPFS